MILKSFSGRKNVSRCPARPTLPGLSGQRRAGDMSDRAPESDSVDALHDHCGKEQTRDLDAADQTIRRYCLGGLWGRG